MCVRKRGKWSLKSLEFYNSLRFAENRPDLEAKSPAGLFFCMTTTRRHGGKKSFVRGVGCDNDLLPFFFLSFFRLKEIPFGRFCSFIILEKEFVCKFPSDFCNDLVKREIYWKKMLCHLGVCRIWKVLLGISTRVSTFKIPSNAFKQTKYCLFQFDWSPFSFGYGPANTSLSLNVTADSRTLLPLPFSFSTINSQSVLYDEMNE